MRLVFNNILRKVDYFNIQRYETFDFRKYTKTLTQFYKQQHFLFNNI